MNISVACNLSNMTLHYKLERRDFLQHQLFNATKSDLVKQQQKKTWLTYTLISFALCGAFYYVGQGQRGNYLVFYFFVLGIIFLFFFPSMQKASQIKNYGLYIDEIYKNRYGHEIQICFTSDNIETVDITGEAKLRLTNIQIITEVKDYFFVKMITGETLIIPKTGVADIDALRAQLTKISLYLSVDFTRELTWR